MARLCLSSQYHILITNKFSFLNQALSRNVTLCTTRVVFSGGFTNSVYTKWNITCNDANLKNIRHYSAPNLNESNIFKSTITDIPNYHGIFLHECIWKNADKWWNKTALVCAMTGKSYTYEQLRKLCGKFATSLRRNNLRPGDTIAAILPNVPEYAIVVIGASEAGIKVTLINPIYTTEEIKKQLINSETAAVITIPSKYPVIAESIVGNSAIRLPVIIIEDETGPAPSGTINFKDLISDNIEEFEKTGRKTEQDPELDTVVLPYSSGTTGLPKGVELTHRNLVANLCQYRAKEMTTSEEAIGNHQEIMPLFLPIFHIYGLTCCLSNYLSIGAKLICMPQFSSAGLLEVLEKNKITALYAAPPIIQLIADDNRFNSGHMENVKIVMSGAAPMGQEVIDKFLKRVGSHLNLTQGYGLTETGPVISRSKKAPLESSGLILAHTEVRIVGYEDKNKGQNLGTKQVGEIYVRGPQIMKGYYKNPQATQDCMDGDWFKTGDIGSIDDQDFLYLHGRLKELIKVQGYQVSPAELEDILQGHEKVADAAVIGVPHERYGEIPKAFVVPKQHMRIDDQEIKDYVAKRVTKYKQLGHVVTIDKIPKSAAGKILRRELQKK